jgi:subtilase family serine protease
VPAAVSSGKAALVGSLPTSQEMNVTLVLPLRNQDALTSLLDELYDPSNPKYRQFLTVAQFTEQFGPAVDDYQKVVQFAQGNGLAVTDTPPNRLIVPVRGTVAQIQSAFNVQMNVYRHPTENRTFYSPDREPSPALTVPLRHIAGLDNFQIPRHSLTKRAAEQVVPGVVGSGPGGTSYTGSDIRAAYYGGSALAGSGQVVGLLELGEYNIADVNASFANVGQAYSVPINNVLLDGTPPSPGGSDDEQVIDIVAAIGMAPALSQVRVYIGSADKRLVVYGQSVGRRAGTRTIGGSRTNRICCVWRLVFIYGFERHQRLSGGGPIRHGRRGDLVDHEWRRRPLAVGDVVGP